jgi:EAL domain-containing protein (putative c-di-GMP-specific phosphodiesterase class I)
LCIKDFSVNLSASKKKQRWIELIVEYCKDANVQLVLEGIEKSEDLATAKALGVSIGQGYLLGKPDILDNMIF